MPSPSCPRAHRAGAAVPSPILRARHLSAVRDDGREHAARWLEASFGQLGRESTIDVHERYL